MWLAGSTHAGSGYFLERHGDLRCAGYWRAAGLSLYAVAGLASGAPRQLPIIASGVIYGIPGISQQPVLAPVLRVVGLWRPGTGLKACGIGFATLSVYRPLVQRALTG